MKSVSVKVLNDDLEEYTFSLDKVMALRTLKLISKSNEYNLDLGKLKIEYMEAAEKIARWWENISNKYSIPINGRNRRIDYQNNLIFLICSTYKL